LLLECLAVRCEVLLDGDAGVDVAGFLYAKVDAEEEAVEEQEGGEEEEADEAVVE
jgi:hypothetical protein